MPTAPGLAIRLLTLVALACALPACRDRDEPRPPKPTTQATTQPSTDATTRPVATRQRAAPDWPMFRANLRRTGNPDGGAGPSVPKFAWAFTDPDANLADFSSSPAVVGDRVYTAAMLGGPLNPHGAVYCLDAKTGKLVWRVKTPKPIFSSPAVVAGRVYVGEGLHEDKDCRFRCLDAETGQEIWHHQVASHAEGTPTVVGGRIYVGAGDDGLLCLDADTGRRLWQVPGFHIDASPAVTPDGQVFVGTGYDRAHFLRVDARGGTVLWARPMEASAWGDPAVDPGTGRVYFGLSGATLGANPDNKDLGRVYCVDPATGRPEWSADLKNGVGEALALDGGDLIFGSWDYHLYCHDPATGRRKWAANLGGVVFSSPALDAARAYLGTQDGRIVAIDRGTGLVAWDLRPDTPDGTQILSSPALVAGRLYVGTGVNLFVCVEEGAAPQGGK